MQKQRTVKETQKEIKAAKADHLAKYGKRTIRKTLPGLYSANEIDSLVHIAWLEGYVRAMRDERGLK